MPTSNFEEQSVQSPCTTEQGLSPRVHYHYTSASRTSLPEGIPASTATLHATHAEVAKECHWCHGGPCMEHEECRVMLDTVQMIAAAQISAVQEQVVFAGSSYIPRDGPNGWAEEEMCLITPGILHDVDSTKSWMQFNASLIDEVAIVCRWVACNDLVKVKDINTHLEHRHGMQSNSQLYKCLWKGQCSAVEMKRASLVRHIRETHSSIKWVCPACGKTFTRRTTLLRHFERREQLQG